MNRTVLAVSACVLGLTMGRAEAQHYGHSHGGYFGPSVYVPHTTTHTHLVPHRGHYHAVPHTTTHYHAVRVAPSYHPPVYGPTYVPHTTTHIDLIRHRGHYHAVPHTSTHYHRVP